MSQTLDGVGATPLSGLGTALWYRPDEFPDPEDVEAADPETEHERFEEARATAREELGAERERTAERVGEEEAAVFDAHLQFLDDPQIVEGVEDAIDDGAAAEAGVARAFGDAIEQFEGMEGMMAERADDMRDIRDRLLRILSGGERVDLAELPEGTVLLAERLTPSDTAQLDPERVAGFATMTGGRTSHAAIFARSLGIPAVVGAGDALADIEEDADVAVDAENDAVILDPDEATRERVSAEREVDVKEERVETIDGREIEVAANLGTTAEIDGASAQGADGVGLYRTEFLFLDRESPPDEDEQVDAYVEALDAFPEGRVVVRTLDVGGDKPVPYLDLPEEENPFLGNRGIRRSLADDGDLFETQLRALLRAAAEGAGELSVMFPLVATVEELDEALELVESVAADLDEDGIDHATPELGVMVETPAAALMADEFAARVDFLSIGTNDLAQYVMASSRENDAVSHLHDPRHPPVLRAIDRSVEAAHDNDAWIGMCGEMAGNPELTKLLVGLGLDELSMSAVTIPDVKAGVEAIDTADARDLADRALAASTKEDVVRILSQES
ncbi:phosphotransferase system, enzyme I, PtsI [Natronoarchaeum philippinense]|uniref:Phosphoenolpyruvate-protein phosphotransferase n=1 Tax=Natronoarchaeum philippinense TaxID=558529 RepID=A0A285NSS0_NATPI|nr:phosphoenolpyruvate--protein phosphotransferase [Natronoarchaeum philippinense]SNZ12509.1 phosphotransferase system, enzyme I, PtsI [Natronoarchaeum philippinense]